MKKLLLIGVSLLAIAGSARAGTQDFDFSGASTIWTAPVTGTYDIEVFGAQGGGASGESGGLGGEAAGVFALTAGQQITIVVGQAGHYSYYAGGGGGMSMVAIPGDFRLAGGGGGGGSMGNGNGGDGGVANGNSAGTPGLASSLFSGGGGGASYKSNGANNVGNEAASFGGFGGYAGPSYAGGAGHNGGDGGFAVPAAAFVGFGKQFVKFSRPGPRGMCVNSLRIRAVHFSDMI